MVPAYGLRLEKRHLNSVVCLQHTNSSTAPNPFLCEALIPNNLPIMIVANVDVAVTGLEYRGVGKGWVAVLMIVVKRSWGAWGRPTTCGEWCM